MHWNELKNDLKHLVKHYIGGGGANLSKINSQIRNALNNGQKEDTKCDRLLKSAKHRFCKGDVTSYYYILSSLTGKKPLCLEAECLVFTNDTVGHLSLPVQFTEFLEKVSCT